MKKNISILLIVLVSSCYRGTPTPPDAPSCDSACLRLRSLGCPEGQPVESPNGTIISCTEWCEYSIETLKVDLNPTCVASLDDCKNLELKCYSGELKN